MFLLYDKTSRRTSLRTSAFLIIVFKVLCCQTLTCRPEEYQIDNECCPMCPPGGRVETDCTESSLTSCLPCSSGTYMDKFTGHKQCFQCTNCDTGSGLKVKTSCTTRSDTVCEPLEGFFCIDLTKDQCAAAQKHKDCGPGQYIKEKGTSSSDTVCSDCSNGTFSDGTLTSCHQHTQCESMNLQLITAGTSSTDSVCEEKTLNVGAIVGVIIGLVVVLVILIAVVVSCFKRKNKCAAVTDKNNHANNSIEKLQGTRKSREESMPLSQHEENPVIHLEPSVKLLKSADDTIVIGLIQDGDESAYRGDVDQLVLWCSQNHLELNPLKTVDFRKRPPPTPPLTTLNRTVPTVDSFRFLGSTI